MTYVLNTATFTTPRGTTVEMVHREGTNDWNTLRSCLTEDEYHLGDRFLTGVAVDIGAHIGGATVALAVDNPTVGVVAIEPLTPNLALLRNNVERNGVADRVTVIAGAVGDGSRVSIRYGYRGDEALEHHAFIGNITLAHGLNLDHETVEYDSLTLWDVLQLATEEPQLLKIDVEGAEYPFFNWALHHGVSLTTVDGPRSLNPVTVALHAIVGEWHNNDGHKRADLTSLLRDTHKVTFSGPVAGPGGFLAECKHP